MKTSDLFEGTLEIDYARGVIYFHNPKGRTMLRICNLPSMNHVNLFRDMLDITHMVGCSWHKRNKEIKLWYRKHYGYLPVNWRDYDNDN
jgi:hypothetical protein